MHFENPNILVIFDNKFNLLICLLLVYCIKFTINCLCGKSGVIDHPSPVQADQVSPV